MGPELLAPAVGLLVPFGVQHFFGSCCLELELELEVGMVPNH